MKKSRRAATYEDIEALPVGWVGEILEDELVASPRPALPHARVGLALSALLGMAFDLGQPETRGGWWLLYEPELHLGGNVLVPDLAGWRRERVPVPSFKDAPFATIAPDWVCEILSPASVSIDRERKLPFYHREGVGHVWLVDPPTQTLEIHRRRARGWRLIARHTGDQEVFAEPFDALALRLGALWWPRGPNARGETAGR
ncbi:Uma2 family endonuclease [Cystobacter fuscus]|uniref:Uma2 family endonuclease n=1 Tax=Cystobacter fuscus TaxID=43 RepID=UPI002B313690|nr:Uma2 family endonuclease [Cystobacter fuscus]